jgi:hypothetical protein
LDFTDRVGRVKESNGPVKIWVFQKFPDGGWAVKIRTVRQENSSGWVIRTWWNPAFYERESVDGGPIPPPEVKNADGLAAISEIDRGEPGLERGWSQLIRSG